MHEGSQIYLNGESSQASIRALGLANARPVALARIGLMSDQYARGSLPPPLNRFL
jgi:hypothetical protein